MNAPLPVTDWRSAPAAAVRIRFNQFCVYERERLHLSYDAIESNLCRRLQTLTGGHVSASCVRALRNPTSKRKPGALLKRAIERLTAKWPGGAIREREWSA